MKWRALISSVIAAMGSAGSVSALEKNQISLMTKVIRQQNEGFNMVSIRHAKIRNKRRKWC